MTEIVLQPKDGSRPETRAQTLQERFGFRDHELADERHDRIVGWIHQHLNTLVQQTAADLLVWSETATRDALDRWRFTKTVLYEGCRNVLHNRDTFPDTTVARAQALLHELDTTFSAPPAFPDCPFEPPNAKWEHAISTPTNYVVGFVDLRASVRCAHMLSLAWFDFASDRASWDPGSVVEVVRALFPEKLPTPQWQVQTAPDMFRHHVAVNFEAKGSIRSAGEILRQIRLYQQHDAAARYAVVSPDTRFADILRDQGVAFVEYREDPA